MTLAEIATATCACLLTYLVHSVAVLAPVWLLLRKFRAPASPELRVLVWKLAILAPCVTVIAVTCIGGPHFGLEIALGEQSEHSSAAIAQSGGSSRGFTAPEPWDVSTSWAFNSVPTAADAELVSGSPLAVNEAITSTSRSVAIVGGGQIWMTGMSCLWLLIAVSGLMKLVFEWNRLRRNAVPILNSTLHESLARLRERMGLRRQVALLSSPQFDSPITAGILSPFVVFPGDSSKQSLCFTDAENEAILAHELAHVVHRDAVWNLLVQIVCRVFFFQPLNLLAARELRQQMDFVADATAARILGEPTSLVHCLFRFAETLSRSSLSQSRMAPLASGMAVFESTLGRRIEVLLDCQQSAAPLALRSRMMLMAIASLGVIAVATAAPRAVGESLPAPSNHDLLLATIERNEVMNKSLTSAVMIAGLAMSAAADDAPREKLPAPQKEAVSLKTTPDELPAGIRGFNGMLVGRVAAKDSEKGTFTLLVDAVARVWENNRAEDPRSLVGKTIQINGVFGRFLDVLIVTRIGETVEFECKHDGDQLVFPGELLRKVAAFNAEDYPTLPDEFRGFKGLVSAVVTKKDPETFELILQVDRIRETWEGSRSKDAKSIEGKSLMLVGFWNRREAYHNLKVGEKIEVGMHHKTLNSDHLTVIEGVRKTGESQIRSEAGSTRSTERAMERKGGDGTPNGLQGFRGMLVGRLVEKDVERGTFTITVDAVPRVWENNQSENPKALIGKQVMAEGVTGRLIDALVVVRTGDTIQFGALYDGGPRIRVGEILHKVTPVKPGDYPVLPDDFRGFRGMVTAKVIRKSDELFELIVEVEQIHETFAENGASNPRSILKKQVMLAGFWNRKDEYHSLSVGDTIRCGMTHTQRLSDHLTVVESLQKTGEK